MWPMAELRAMAMDRSQPIIIIKLTIAILWYAFLRIKVDHAFKPFDLFDPWIPMPGQNPGRALGDLPLYLSGIILWLFVESIEIMFKIWLTIKLGKIYAWPLSLGWSSCADMPMTLNNLAESCQLYYRLLLDQESVGVLAREDEHERGLQPISPLAGLTFLLTTFSLNMLHETKFLSACPLGGITAYMIRGLFPAIVMKGDHPDASGFELRETKIEDEDQRAIILRVDSGVFVEDEDCLEAGENVKAFEGKWLRKEGMYYRLKK